MAFPSLSVRPLREIWLSSISDTRRPGVSTDPIITLSRFWGPKLTSVLWDVLDRLSRCRRNTDENAFAEYVGDDIVRTETDGTVRLWMVERTYSADSPNILVIVYSTTDGTRCHQKEWAFNRYGASDVPEVTAAIEVEPDRLVDIDDEEIRERYAYEAERMANRHDPDDPV